MGWERETWFNKQLVGYKRVEKLGCSGSTFFHMKPGKIRPGGLREKLWVYLTVHTRLAPSSFKEGEITPL